MSAGNTKSSYGTVTKTFHWLTALLIFTAFPLGIIAHKTSEALLDPSIPSTNDDILRTVLFFSLHKTTGVLIFFVALARILWAISQPKPGLLNAENRIESFLAETVHWLLYGSLVLAPLTGWIHHAATVGYAPIWWPFGQSLPFVPKDPHVSETFAGLHFIFVAVLAISLVLHIAGAIKHHFVDRDSTLRRMLPGHANAPTPPAQNDTLLPPMAAILIWAVALGIGSAMGGSGDLPVQSHDQTTPVQPAQTAANWQVQNGTLGLAITQMGSPVAGSFADWTADIIFDDPAAPGPAGTVTVTIAIASLTLGTVADQAMGPDFFDAQIFPTATFVGEIAKTETGYVATGPLTIRDKSQPITLPFDLSLDNGTATLTGATTVNRMDFGIGGSMPTEGTLGFDVDIAITLTATQIASAD